METAHYIRTCVRTEQQQWRPAVKSVNSINNNSIDKCEVVRGTHNIFFGVPILFFSLLFLCFRFLLHLPSHVTRTLVSVAREWQAKKKKGKRKKWGKDKKWHSFTLRKSWVLTFGGCGLFFSFLSLLPAPLSREAMQTIISVNSTNVDSRPEQYQPSAFTFSRIDGCGKCTV